MVIIHRRVARRLVEVDGQGVLRGLQITAFQKLLRGTETLVAMLYVVVIALVVRV